MHARLPKDVVARLPLLGPYPPLSILNPQHFYRNQALLDWLAKHQLHAVTLHQLAGFGRKLTAQKLLALANFVRVELPTRLAMRIRDLQELPFGATNNFHMVQVYESFYHAFNLFRRYPTITLLEENEQFLHFLSDLLAEHRIILPHLVMGALECSILEALAPAELDLFMLGMLRLRISRRTIIEQHVLMTKAFRENPETDRPANYIGDMFVQCDPVEELHKSAAAIRASLAEEHPEWRLPEVRVDCVDSVKPFPFLLSHLLFVFGEILRNSMEHTARVHQDTASIPAVEVSVSSPNDLILFRFSDCGGGLPDRELELVWSFSKRHRQATKLLQSFHQLPGLLLTAESVLSALGIPVPSEPRHYEPLRNTSLEDDGMGSLAALTTRPALRRLGLGLAMCKVYAEYWNGEIKMRCMEGYGSDTYLRLSKLGTILAAAQMDRA